MSIREQKSEEDNNQRGTLASVLMHILLLLCIYFMPATHKPKNTEMPQIQVELPQDLMGGAALGLPDQGSGDDKPTPGRPDPDAGNSEPDPAPEPDPVPVPIPKPAPPKMVIPKPTPPPQKRIETTEDPNAAVIRRQQEETRKKAEEEKYRAQADAREKQRQADEAAKREAAAKKFGDRFKTGTSGGTNGGGGDGSGRGNTGKPGNQGNPDGDPNSGNLTGIGSGPGNVSGFGGRKVVNFPRLQENSQKSGKVVLDICVDNSGGVSSAKFKAAGSTTTDAGLIEAATRNAKQYKFAASSVEKQCGSITYTFIVR
jgi:outer membrane biosynthesis protein TonB